MSQTSGFEYDAMTKVINGTESAIERMEKENQVVTSIHQRLPFLNDSRAGDKLSLAISEWTQSYEVIVGLLRDLNGRAISTRGTMADAAMLGEQVSNR